MLRPLLDWLPCCQTLAVGFKSRCDPGFNAPLHPFLRCHPSSSSTNQEEVHRTVDLKHQQLVVVVM